VALVDVDVFSHVKLYYWGLKVDNDEVAGICSTLAGG
jgi:hypothetical protein